MHSWLQLAMVAAARALATARTHANAGACPYAYVPVLHVYPDPACVLVPLPDRDQVHQRSRTVPVVRVA